MPEPSAPRDPPLFLSFFFFFLSFFFLFLFTIPPNRKQTTNNKRANRTLPPCPHSPAARLWKSRPQAVYISTRSAIVRGCFHGEVYEMWDRSRKAGEDVDTCPEGQEVPEHGPLQVPELRRLLQGWDKQLSRARSEEAGGATLSGTGALFELCRPRLFGKCRTCTAQRHTLFFLPLFSCLSLALAPFTGRDCTPA